MKKYLQFAFLALVLMLIIPIIPLIGENEILQEPKTNISNTESNPAQPSQPPAQSTPESAQSSQPESKDQSITVFNHKTKEVETLPMLDYIKGVVCAEIPPSFSEEAIKAQAVIAHTYALHIMEGQKQNPDEALQGAMISTDSSKYQAYFTPKEIKKQYGSKYDEYWKKISDCVDAVFGQVLTYEDQPIIAAFHSISSGATEDAANVWGQSLPYLVSATSEGDPLSPHYENSQTFTEQEVRDLLLAQFPDIAFTDDQTQWFAIQSNTPSGYVNQINVLNQTTTGQKVRSIFGLKSADFSVAFADGKFTFTTKGYGHGVGLSQYGADYFAKQGMVYSDILAHYYPNTVLKTM